ncbi:hypothetical protein CDL15_Pgr021671 [Punica granatum]|uniref:Caffeic acid 3-O-methyltransferase-like n=1 Tax=Punica granatum TaxID=22663 RepID=A0A218WRM3_PUNGR|nr:hypothetical protein CDL15_Pgr021671 [Punica granatum]
MEMDSTGETSTMNPAQPQAPKVDEENTYLLAMQLTRASELPMVLKTAIELGLLEIISKFASGPMSAKEISAHLPTQNPDAPVMIDRILRLLATRNIVTCSLLELLAVASNAAERAERVYGPAPVCKFLTQNEYGVSLAPFCLMIQDKVLMESCYYLKDAILEGGVPFDKVYGTSSFEYYRTNSRYNQIINWGLSNQSAIVMTKILETYKGFEGLSALVDVSGGIGATLNMIISKYPTIKGINFDMRRVIEEAPSHPGDAILLKEMCREWSDRHCLKILQNCYKALPKDGKVIVAECLLPEVPDTSPASKLVVHADCIKLSYNSGGKERTKEEFEALAKGAGFKGFGIACKAFETCIVEFLKQGN